MEYRNFERLNVKPSLLGFGCMRFPTLDNGQINEKEAEAIVAPAVVEAVAAAIKMEEKGAIILPPTFHPCRKVMTTSFKSEAEMTPARVPVPTRSRATGAILESP